MPACGFHTEVYEMETKKPINGVTSVDLKIRAREIIKAKIEIEIEEINLEDVEVEEVLFFERISGKRYKLVEL